MLNKHIFHYTQNYSANLLTPSAYALIFQLKLSGNFVEFELVNSTKWQNKLLGWQQKLWRISWKFYYKMYATTPFRANLGINILNAIALGGAYVAVSPKGHIENYPFLDTLKKKTIFCFQCGQKEIVYPTVAFMSFRQIFF